MHVTCSARTKHAKTLEEEEKGCYRRLSERMDALDSRVQIQGRGVDADAGAGAATGSISCYDGIQRPEDRALAVEHHRRWKLQTVTVQACGGGVLLYSSGCSSRRWIESAVAGKKGVGSSGNCDGQR